MCLSQVTVSVQGLLENVENDNSFCCNLSDVYHAVDKYILAVYTADVWSTSPVWRYCPVNMAWLQNSENQPKNGVG